MGFRFAAAVSGHANLYKAIADVAGACWARLGRMPDLCQLLITTEHARNLVHAPEFLLDELARREPGGAAAEPQPPVVIGAVVKSVCGPGGVTAPGSGVSLLAACLPGVLLSPFHTPTAALPQLPGSHWARLLRHAAQEQRQQQQQQQQQQHTAALLLAAPHFTDVEKLLQRLGGALPGMPLLGGVTAHDAWLDTEQGYGALFCGRQVFCQGAVGCILHGPIAVQQLLVPGCRPAAGGQRPLTVTESAGNALLALDGAPIHTAVVSMLDSLPDAERRCTMLLGIQDAADAGGGDAQQPFDAHSFVPRSMSLRSTTSGQPVLLAATHEVPVGSRVQLLLQDFEQCQQQQEARLAALVDGLPAAAAADPSQYALLSYHCEAVPGDEAQLVTRAWPQVPYAGGRMQGEFAGPQRCGAVAPAKLHSYAATFGVLSHVDAQPDAAGSCQGPPAAAAVSPGAAHAC